MQDVQPPRGCPARGAQPKGALPVQCQLARPTRDASSNSVALPILSPRVEGVPPWPLASAPRVWARQRGCVRVPRRRRGQCGRCPRAAGPAKLAGTTRATTPSTVRGLALNAHRPRASALGAPKVPAPPTRDARAPWRAGRRVRQARRPNPPSHRCTGGRKKVPPHGPRRERAGPPSKMPPIASEGGPTAPRVCKQSSAPPAQRRLHGQEAARAPGCLMAHAGRRDVMPPATPPGILRRGPRGDQQSYSRQPTHRAEAAAAAAPPRPSAHVAHARRRDVLPPATLPKFSKRATPAPRETHLVNKFPAQPVRRQGNRHR